MVSVTRENAEEIANSLERTLTYFPYQTNPIDKRKVIEVVRSISIPEETERMRFELPLCIAGPNNENLNSQYDGKSGEHIDIALRAVVTNKFSDYSPLLPVRVVRKIREKRFEEEKFYGREDYYEVLCRKARNNPSFYKLFESSLKAGFKYSLLAMMEILYSSEKEGETWVKSPLFVFPGIYGQNETKNRSLARKIFAFADEYQKPDRDFLEQNGFFICLRPKSF